MGELVHAAAQPGVVDQDLDRPPILGEAGDGLIDGVLVAHVQAERVGYGLVLVRKRLGQFFDPFDASGAHQDPRPFGRKSLGGGFPDPCARAGDENDLIFERYHAMTP